MEGSDEGKSAPKTADRVPKQPVLVVEFAQTPDYLGVVGQKTRSRSETDTSTSSENVEALLSPLPKPLTKESSMNDFQNSNNLLLTEEEKADVTQQENVIRIAVGLSVFCTVIGVYYAYKWGYFSPTK